VSYHLTSFFVCHVSTADSRKCKRTTVRSTWSTPVAQCPYQISSKSVQRITSESRGQTDGQTWSVQYALISCTSCKECIITYVGALWVRKPAASDEINKGFGKNRWHIYVSEYRSLAIQLRLVSACVRSEDNMKLHRDVCINLHRPLNITNFWPSSSAQFTVRMSTFIPWHNLICPVKPVKC
jgi:hypothetical protein